MADQIRKVRKQDLTPEQQTQVDAFRASRRTPEARAEEKQVRERFQRDKPSLEELIASGEYQGPLRHGDVMALLSALAELKRQREQRGLTLTEVSERSGLDVGMISRLENGKIVNPTMTTLWRYAEAIGMQIAWNVEPTPAEA